MKYKANWRSEIHPEGKSIIIENNTEEENIESLKALVRRFYLLPNYTSFKTAARLFRFRWQGMLQGNMMRKEQRIHPTQKPVALYSWIFQKYAKPGIKILDTHLGSGSSRIAAYNAGLDFYACEIDKHYYDAQEERFQRECKGVYRFGECTVIEQNLFI